MAKNATGKVTQVIGAVVDVQFDGEIPAILNALHTKNGDNLLVLRSLSTSVSARFVRSPWTEQKVWSAVSRLKIPAPRSWFRLDRKPWAGS